jgi:hypothetical protein
MEWLLIGIAGCLLYSGYLQRKGRALFGREMHYTFDVYTDADVDEQGQSIPKGARLARLRTNLAPIELAYKVASDYFGGTYAQPMAGGGYFSQPGGKFFLLWEVQKNSGVHT